MNIWGRVGGPKPDDQKFLLNNPNQITKIDIIAESILLGFT